MCSPDCCFTIIKRICQTVVIKGIICCSCRTYLRHHFFYSPNCNCNCCCFLHAALWIFHSNGCVIFRQWLVFIFHREVCYNPVCHTFRIRRCDLHTCLIKRLTYNISCFLRLFCNTDRTQLCIDYSNIHSQCYRFFLTAIQYIVLWNRQRLCCRISTIFLCQCPICALIKFRSVPKPHRSLNLQRFEHCLDAGIIFTSVHFQQFNLCLVGSYTYNCRRHIYTVIEGFHIICRQSIIINTHLIICSSKGFVISADSKV